uniref:Uncharacterized protein n=1 Tax=viral metagenome TaxID=1070528 RepID=A0A6C0HHJ2_9ZZZZ
MNDYLQNQLITFVIVATLLAFLQTDLDKKLDDLLKRITKKNAKEWAIELFWNGSYTYTFVKHHCGKLYSTYPLVRSFVDAIGGPINSAKSNDDYPWASITQLVEEADGRLRIIEDFFDLSDDEWIYKTMNENLPRFNNMCRDILQNNTTISECLLLIAENAESGIHSRVFNRYNMDADTDVIINNNPVNMKFLSIDYVHPTQPEPYEIVVDKSYFMKGNHLLSGAFIGRLLADSEYTGVFDKDYRIAVIDQEVKNAEWEYDNYIEVAGEKTYVLHFFVNSSPENNGDTSNSQNMLSTDDISSPPDNTQYTLFEPLDIDKERDSSISNTNEDDEETKSWDKVDMET